MDLFFYVEKILANNFMDLNFHTAFKFVDLEFESTEVSSQ
jgi:hypothetical protein